MNLIFTEPISGKCPVQAEGTINGHEFYFRSRGGGWALHVSRAGGDPLDKFQWHHYEDYPGTKDETPVEMYGGKIYFSAGWAGDAECLDFIQRAAAKFVAEQELKK